MDMLTVVAVYEDPTAMTPRDEMTLFLDEVLPEAGSLLTLPTGEEVTVAHEELSLPLASWTPGLRRLAVHLTTNPPEGDSSTEALCKRVEAFTGRRRRFRALESFAETVEEGEDTLSLDQAFARAHEIHPGLLTLTLEESLKER